MGRGALAAAWAISLLPGILAAFGPSWDLGVASQLGWALVPWIALAGLPAGTADPGSDGDARGVSPAVAAALALPPLALTAALDRHAGLGVGVLAATGVAGLALVFLLALAARRGRKRPLAHGSVWLGLVPLAALAAWTAGLSGSAPAWLATLGGASPLTWALERAGDPAGDPVGGAARMLGPLAVVVLCLAASAGAPER